MSRATTKPIFSARHYEALARLVAELCVDSGYDITSGVAMVRISDLFKDDNPRFKPELFGKRVHQIMAKLDCSKS